MPKPLKLFFLTIVIHVNVYGHGGDGFVFVLLSQTSISTFGLYDSKNEKFLQSFDLNSSFFLLNGGLTYKNIDYMDTYNLSAYLGLGLGNLIQLQAGFWDGFSIRNRYEIPISLFFVDYDDFIPWITISPSIEKYFNNSRKNWYFGLGIGISFNNFQLLASLFCSALCPYFYFD
jgi:hypothetical protein